MLSEELSCVLLTYKHLGHHTDVVMQRLDGIKGSTGHTHSPGRHAQIRDNMELSEQAPASRVARTKDTSILYARLF